MSNVSLSDVFFQALNVPKLVFDPAGARGAYDALPDGQTSSRLERTPFPQTLPPRSIYRFLGSLQTKFLSTPMLLSDNLSAKVPTDRDGFGLGYRTYIQ